MVRDYGNCVVLSSPKLAVLFGWLTGWNGVAAGETASLDAFCGFFAGVKLTKGTQVREGSRQLCWSWSLQAWGCVGDACCSRMGAPLVSTLCHVIMHQDSHQDPSTGQSDSFTK